MAIEKRIVWLDGQLQEVEADWGETPQFAPEPVANPVTYKADIWRRATDDQAEAIEAQINAQPVRLRNMFRDAQFLDHSDPYFIALKAGFVDAFGQAVADELLAQSL